MTVSEVVKVLKDAESVSLSWNGSLHNLDLQDPIMMNAFGDNIVAGIYANADNSFEISIAVRPLKKGEAL